MLGNSSDGSMQKGAWIMKKPSGAAPDMKHEGANKDNEKSPKELTDIKTNYKGQLQQVCQRKNWPLPGEFIFFHFHRSLPFIRSSLF